MKKVKYYSSDKLYQVPVRKKLKIKGFILVLILPSIIALLTGLFFLNKGLIINGDMEEVGYVENGNSNYKVYLNDNAFEKAEFIEGGENKKFVASLIKFINTKFKYEIHADQNLDFSYKYKIIGDLIISDKEDGKELHRKTYNLKEEVSEELSSNNLVINDDVDIDYDLYNDYANSFKNNYAVLTDSKLVVRLIIDVNGSYEEVNEKINKENEIDITIPLSEQTVDIEMTTDEINNNGSLNSKVDVKVVNVAYLTIGIILTIVGIFVVGIAIYVFIKYRNKNLYQMKVNKLLNDYDRLIVVGGVDIDESKYKNKVYPESFEELVDAAERLQKPILFYEVIPNEKCFFVIIADNTIYKYRLTRAYLEKEQQLYCEKSIKDA